MKALITCLVCSAALVSATPALAADPSDTFAQKVATLDYFVGEWNCQESGASGASNAQVHMRSWAGDANSATGGQATATSVLDASWVVLDWQSGDTTSAGNFNVGHSYMSYDPAKQIFVDFTFSPRGGYAIASSQGWQDLSTLRWTGTAFNFEGKSIAQRKTFVIIEQAIFTITIENSLDGVSYNQTSRKVCHRS